MAVNSKKICKIRASKNLRSTIASFAVEGFTPSKEALEYCKLRDTGEVNLREEIEGLKKKYKEMGRS